MPNRIQIEVTVNRESLYNSLRQFINNSPQEKERFTKAIETEGLNDACYDLASRFVSRNMRLSNPIFSNPDFAEVESICSEILVNNARYWLS